MLFGFVLELRHAGQLSEHRVAVQHPAELGVCGNMRLEKECVLFGIQTTGNIDRQHLQRPPAQLLRILTDRDRVHVRHEVVTVVVVDTVCPVLDRAQIIAQVQIAAGLDPGQHDFLFFAHV